MLVTMLFLIVFSLVHLLAALIGIFTLLEFEDIFTKNGSFTLSVIHFIVFCNFINNTMYLYKLDYYFFEPCLAIPLTFVSVLIIIYSLVSLKYLKSLDTG